VVHEVKPGENLYRISSWYDVPISEILDANGLEDPRALRPGQRLRIPHARRPPALEPLLPPPGIRPPEGSPLERPRSQFEGLEELRPNALARLRARLAARLAGNEFAWPLAGRLSSGFGRRDGRPHQGIDVRAPAGAPVRAAESGRVSFVGRLGAYGNVLVLRHDGAFSTVYAHLSRHLVRRGERVRRGQIVAEVGATGNATGPHLHFEIRRRDRALNPLLFLPPTP
jgi:lipoprotein NlpD